MAPTEPGGGNGSDSDSSASSVGGKPRRQPEKGSAGGPVAATATKGKRQEARPALPRTDGKRKRHLEESGRSTKPRRADEHNRDAKKRRRVDEIRQVAPRTVKPVSAKQLKKENEELKKENDDLKRKLEAALEAAGSPPAAAQCRADDQLIKWRPFQQRIIDLVEKPSNGRTITWIYSLEGEVGKSLVGKWLVDQRGALIISGTAEVDARDLIRREKEKNGKFEARPIVVVDLPRAKSRNAQQNKLYSVLEALMGSFHSTKGSGAVVGWKCGQEPRVIVFANETPEHDRLSADRLEVYLVNTEHFLVKAEHMHKQIDRYKEEIQALQQEEEAAAASGELPPRLMMRGQSGGGGGSGEKEAHHALRVKALGRLFKRKENSPRQFRHEIYACIAEREPDVWALCGTAEQRDKAVREGSHIRVIVEAWDRALRGAFSGFTFGHPVRGSKNEQNPNGTWTTGISLH